MNVFTEVPDWLLLPLPTNAVVDAALMAEIDQQAKQLPQALTRLNAILYRVRGQAVYDVAVNRVCAHVWRAIDYFFASPDRNLKLALLRFSTEHMVPEAQARILRRLVKDPDHQVRRQAYRAVEERQLREVALPAGPDEAWDSSGWLAGLGEDKIGRHQQGRSVQEKHGVPVISTNQQLRKLLDIRSEGQLGYFLLASEVQNGPYVTFTIPKRDGRDREICAPKPQLRFVQRKILDEILAKVRPHDAAHGFIPGRSIVTNAAKHQGAKLLVKFDLSDFFPTIHYYRVMGLFASLGYGVGDTRFHSADDSRTIAPTLARLCCYTPNPRLWGNAKLPQGAPTSPAISNLVCRRLDARLSGLAEKKGGVYTRYADDLTFSFRETKDLDLGRFRWWVDQVCHQEGFFVNQKKFRVIRYSQRQVVTGLVVNEVLRIPRKDRRKYRAILHNCEKHGVAAQVRDNARFESYLRGFAAYIHMVHPEEGEELLKRVDALLGTTE